MQVYLDEHDYKKLKMLAITSDTDVSKMVRAIIKTYLSKRPDYQGGNRGWVNTEMHGHTSMKSIGC